MISFRAFVGMFAAALAIAGVGIATPASAQATRTWVSGVGDDLNPCSRTAPCKTFAGAFSKTLAGGEINCLDPGGYGALTINKSITIDCIGTNGSILSSNTNGIIVNGAGVVVTLRNITINNANTTTGNGVRILQAAAVNIDNVTIENLGGAVASANGRGITIETSTANVRVTVHNTRIFNANNGGIFSNPSAGSVNLAIDHVTIARGGASGIDLVKLTSAVIDNTQVTDESNGAGLILEQTTSAATLSNSVLANNLIGITNGGGGQTPASRVYGSTITGNSAVGLQILSGTITSLGNNIIRGNAGNEVPSSTIATQ